MFTSKKIGLVLALSLMFGLHNATQAQTDKEKELDQKHHIGIILHSKHLGIIAGALTPERIQDLKLGDRKGVLVRDVLKDTSADRAGLKSGDVIIEMDGQAVESYRDLRSKINNLDYGKSASLRIIRDGAEQQLSFTLDKPDKTRAYTYAYGTSKEEMEKAFEKAKEARKKAFEDHRQSMQDYKQEIEKARAKAKEFREKDFSFAYNYGRPRLGIGAEGLTEQLGKFFGVEKGKGVLVTEVVGGSAAEQAGIQAGDVILEVNGVAISNNMQLRKELNKVDSGAVRLSIMRNHQKIEITANLEKAAMLTEKDFYTPFITADNVVVIPEGKSNTFNFQFPEFKQIPQLEAMPEILGNPEFHFNFDSNSDLQDLQDLQDFDITL
jgi:serine protease Do